jgi:hypothetical protein
MKRVKKSMNLRADIVQKIEEYVKKNPGMTFTLIVNQALKQWLNNPCLDIATPQLRSNDDMEQLLKDHQKLIDRLED